MNLKKRILKEMVETSEDETVRKLRGCDGFDEDFIRKRFRELNDALCVTDEVKK